MRLIDADALMQTLGITDMDCGKCAWYSKAYRRCKRGGDFEDACCAIEDAPTIEAVQERKGQWCFTPDGMMVCSNCHDIPTNRIIVDGSLIYDMTPIKKRMKFCPNCGAHMDEVAE